LRLDLICDLDGNLWLTLIVEKDETEVSLANAAAFVNAAFCDFEALCSSCPIPAAGPVKGKTTGISSTCASAARAGDTKCIELSTSAMHPKRAHRETEYLICSVILSRDSKAVQYRGDVWSRALSRPLDGYNHLMPAECSSVRYAKMASMIENRYHHA
jgi:hypothetical protein